MSTLLVHNCGKLFDRSPVEQNVHLDQISRLVACILIVEAVAKKKFNVSPMSVTSVRFKMRKCMWKDGCDIKRKRFNCSVAFPKI